MKFFVALLALFALVCSVISVKNEICDLPSARNGDGRIACMAYIPSFTYDAGANKCVSFIYGGCGGNANRFATLEECEQKCK